MNHPQGQASPSYIVRVAASRKPWTRLSTRITTGYWGEEIPQIGTWKLSQLHSVITWHKDAQELPGSKNVPAARFSLSSSRPPFRSRWQNLGQSKICLYPGEKSQPYCFPTVRLRQRVQEARHCARRLRLSLRHRGRGLLSALGEQPPGLQKGTRLDNQTLFRSLPGWQCSLSKIRYSGSQCSHNGPPIATCFWCHLRL